MIAFMVRSIVAPRVILIDMLGAKLFRISPVFPGMKLTIRAHISIGISGADIAILESGSSTYTYQRQSGENDGNRRHF